MKILLTLALLFTLNIYSQNTIVLKDGENSPKADLSELAWIEGHWRGEAFGGITEEIWSPPLGDSMMFVFKLVADGKVQFYEIGHIQEKEETLLLQLKHFGGDLKGWEAKDETVTFKLVKIEENKIFFDGFTFERVSPDEINLFVVIAQDDGTKTEEKFNYKRQ